MKIYEVCKTENQLDDLAIVSKGLFEREADAKRECINIAHHIDTILLKVMPSELFDDPIGTFDFIKKESQGNEDRCIFVR